MSAPRDPNLIDEQSFEDYLKRGSPTSQRYRESSDDEPPAALDRRVLDMARDAVEKSRAPAAASRSKPNWMRWSAPLALAASAVLVVSIVIESGVYKETAPLIAPTAERTDKAEPAPEPALHDHAEYERVYTAPAEARVDIASDAEKEARAEATAAPPSREEKVVIQTAPVEVEPQPQFAPSPAAPAPTPAAAVPAGPPAENASPPATESRDAAPEATASARSDAQLSQIVVTGTQRAREAVRASGPRGTVRGVADSAPETDAREQRPTRDPEEWLAEIRELRKAGRGDDADREWKEFRRAYPGFPVDASDAAQRIESANQ